jgi:predicted outer membrane protein
MKKTSFVIALSVMLLTACATQAPQGPDDEAVAEEAPTGSLIRQRADVKTADIDALKDQMRQATGTAAPMH